MTMIKCFHEDIRLLRLEKMATSDPASLATLVPIMFSDHSTLITFSEIRKMASYIEISDVNSMEDTQFEQIFGNVIELCPDAAVQVKKLRPFQTSNVLCAAFHKYLDDLSVEGKLMVLKLHPDLAGRLAARGELTRESTGEQRSAGLSELSLDQKADMDYYNERYKTKFGFPFIICARENKVPSIINGLQQRYKNTREEEISIGINEVKKICQLRILDIVKVS